MRVLVANEQRACLSWSPVPVAAEHRSGIDPLSGAAYAARP